MVMSSNPVVKELGAAAMPASKRVTAEHLSSGREDSRLIEIEGIVRSASVNEQFLTLELLAAGTRAKVEMWSLDREIVDRIVDARVRIRGVCGTAFNDKRQLIGFQISVQDPRKS